MQEKKDDKTNLYMYKVTHAFNPSTQEAKADNFL